MANGARPPPGTVAVAKTAWVSTTARTCVCVNGGSRLCASSGLEKMTTGKQSTGDTKGDRDHRESMINKVKTGTPPGCVEFSEV